MINVRPRHTHWRYEDNYGYVFLIFHCACAVTSTLGPLLSSIQLLKCQFQQCCVHFGGSQAMGLLHILVLTSLSSIALTRSFAASSNLVVNSTSTCVG